MKYVAEIVFIVLIISGVTTCQILDMKNHHDEEMARIAKQQPSTQAFKP